MIGKVSALLLLVSSILCGCKEGRKETPGNDSQGVRTVPTEFVDKGDQAVQNVNKRDAGFVSNRSSEVTLTVSCFGTVKMDELDVLPRPDEASRKDSAVIRQLNTGEVFLLQAGTKGIVLSDAGLKVLVRFQMGELWVWKSATQ